MLRDPVARRHAGLVDDQRAGQGDVGQRPEIAEHCLAVRLAFDDVPRDALAQRDEQDHQAERQGLHRQFPHRRPIPGRPDVRASHHAPPIEQPEHQCPANHVDQHGPGRRVCQAVAGRGVLPAPQPAQGQQHDERGEHHHAA